MPDGQLLVVAPNAPLPGRVPPRSPIGTFLPEVIAAAFLTDTVAMARALPARAKIQVMLTVDADTATPPVTLPDLPTFPSSGNQPGERLVNLLEHGFGMGFRAVCLLGTSTPNLPGVFVQEAFGRLLRNPESVVLGPSENGGYYLVGATGRVPLPLFQDIPWGTESVLTVTAQKALENELSLTLLPSWYDVGTLPDLRRLRRDSHRGVAHASETETLIKDIEDR